MMNPNRGSLGINQRIGHPQLDEGLTRDADAPGFAIDRAQQVDGEVDVDALDLSARTKTTITRGKTKRDVAAVKVGDLVARRNGLCALGKSLASFMTDVDCVAPCAILGTC